MNWYLFEAVISHPAFHSENESGTVKAESKEDAIKYVESWFGNFYDHCAEIRVIIRPCIGIDGALR
jgi:hypothetical protein